MRQAVTEVDRAARSYCQRLLSGGLREKLVPARRLPHDRHRYKEIKDIDHSNYLPDDHVELVYICRPPL